jgi:hypothetical protein
MRYLALDPGFGAMKAAEVQNDEIAVATVPSVVGQGATDLGLLDLAGVTGRRRRKRPHRVTFDGVELLVGSNVAEFARPVERLDFQRLRNGPELRALTYTTLHELLDGGDFDVNLVVGLPVEVLQGPAARETVKRLQGWLVGEHRFTLDGSEARLTVHQVKPMAQPVGAFFDWGLDRRGQWVRPKEDLRVPVAVLDLGFNTLDLFSVKAGQISARYTGGDTLGMRRAATALAERVRREHRRPLSLHEADELLRRYVGGRGRRAVRLPVPGELVDVRDQVRAALEYTVGEVATFVEQTWGNGRQFAHLLLTGGGCLALGEHLARQLPHATLLDDPVTANARGLARLAQRPGLFR